MHHGHRDADQRAWMRQRAAPQHEVFDDYDTVRSVAEQVALRHRVGPGAVGACAVVLPVGDNWWHGFAPGVGLCSVDAARDPAMARTVLTDTFESGPISSVDGGRWSDDPRGER